MTRSVSRKILQIAGLATALSCAGLACAAPPDNHYRIGTGSVGATFYPMMDALCQHINHSALEFTCEALATPGSEHNLRALDNGALDLGLSQAKLQFQAAQGLPPFSKKLAHIRTVAPLHQEVLILVALTDAHISGLSDLNGKRVNLGNVGSGSRLITERLFQYLGQDLAQFEVHASKSADLPALMCNNRIDAAIYSTGHPNAIYRQLLEQCPVTLVDLRDQDIDRFIAANRAFSAATIPANTYPQEPENRQGLGIPVLLSAHRDLPAAHVASIVQILVEQRETLAQRAAIYQTVDAAANIAQPVAPWHPGAQDYRQQQPSSTIGPHQ
jgi:uncharacterized protein